MPMPITSGPELPSSWLPRFFMASFDLLQFVTKGFFLFLYYYYYFIIFIHLFILVAILAKNSKFRVSHSVGHRVGHGLGYVLYTPGISPPEVHRRFNSWRPLGQTNLSCIFIFDVSRPDMAKNWSFCSAFNCKFYFETMKVKTWQALESNLNTVQSYSTSVLTSEADRSFLKSSEVSQLRAGYIDRVNNDCELGNFYPLTDIEKVVVRTLSKHI